LGDLRELVGGALRTLSAEQREVPELRIVRELDHPQIARRLGISEPPARARVSRGLRGLAAALDAAEAAARAIAAPRSCWRICGGGPTRPTGRGARARRARAAGARTSVLVFASAESARALAHVIESERPPTDAVALDGLEVREVVAHA